jgi:uncharacterized protein YidB (DUF937 family)
MQVRSRNTIALAVTALILIGAGIGAGVALGQSQSPSPSPSSEKTKSTTLRRDAFLDDVARRLGIQRSRLDGALKAQALAEVKWAEDNGFLTKAQADALRERIDSGKAKGILKGFGRHGGLGIGLGGLGRHGGSWKGHFHKGPESLMAAANYLGLSARELRDALSSKTLAQVARDRGKSVDGLKAALRTAEKARLDEAVANGRITSAQEDALLERFDSEIGSVINGVPPALTDLARRLGIDRSKLIAAMENAAIAQVDAALARGDIAKAQADAIKQRIRSTAGWTLGGIRLGGKGFCGGPGRFGPEFGFDRGRFSEDALGL